METNRILKPKFPIFLRSLYILVCIFILWLIITGWGYYITSIAERPYHADYFQLKPGGRISHGLGVTGGFLILLTFAYSARKRWKWLKKFGSIPQWLDLHIWFGITGPLLVILHSTFKIHGLIAIAFWCMMAVVISGFIGRFLMRQIPRDIRGYGMNLQTLEKTRADLRDQLLRQPGMNEAQLRTLEHLADPKDLFSAGLVAYFMAILLNNVMLNHRIRKCYRDLLSQESVSDVHRHHFRRLAKEEAILNRRIMLLKTSQNFFKHWHQIHKPFSWVMLLISFIHVAVAVYLGYWWLY
jgi:hypothetical protein